MATKDNNSTSRKPQHDQSSHSEPMRLIGEEICGDVDIIAKANRMLGHAIDGALQPGSAVELGARLEELRDRVSVAHAAIEGALTTLAGRHGLEHLMRGPLARALDAMASAPR